MKKILLVVCLLGVFGINAQSFDDHAKNVRKEAKKQYEENKTEIDEAIEDHGEKAEKIAKDKLKEAKENRANKKKEKQNGAENASDRARERASENSAVAKAAIPSNDTEAEEAINETHMDTEAEVEKADSKLVAAKEKLEQLKNDGAISIGDYELKKETLNQLTEKAKTLSSSLIKQ